MASASSTSCRVPFALSFHRYYFYFLSRASLLAVILCNFNYGAPRVLLPVSDTVAFNCIDRSSSYSGIKKFGKLIFQRRISQNRKCRIALERWRGISGIVRYFLVCRHKGCRVNGSWFIFLLLVSHDSRTRGSFRYELSQVLEKIIRLQREWGMHFPTFYLFY